MSAIKVRKDVGDRTRSETRKPSRCRGEKDDRKSDNDNKSLKTGEKPTESTRKNVDTERDRRGEKLKVSSSSNVKNGKGDAGVGYRRDRKSDVSKKTQKETKESSHVRIKRAEDEKQIKKRDASKESSRLVGKSDGKSNETAASSRIRNERSHEKKSKNENPSSSSRLKNEQGAKKQKSSNSIVKEQYFPSKDLYKNAVQRSLGKEEVKVKNVKQKDDVLSKIYTQDGKTNNPAKGGEGEKPISKEKAKLKRSRGVIVETMTSEKKKEKRDDAERPKTQTKSKDDIILKEIMEREKQKEESQKNSIEVERPRTATLKKAELPTEAPEEYDYEDDFESYASDFEEYSSSSSSTNVDNLPNTGDSSSTTSEEAKDGEEERPKDLEQLAVHEDFDNKENVNALPSFNFAKSQRKLQQQKLEEGKINRGKDILSMVKLDTSRIALFEMSPIPYRDTNGHAVSSQTGDGCLSENIQTDEIETDQKSTQYPIDYSDIKTMQDGHEKKQLLKSRHLQNFVSKASAIVFVLLEESFRRYREKRPTQRGDNHIKFNTGSLEILQNRSVTFITHSMNENTRILTVHGKSKIYAETEDDLKSFVCVWNISNESVPEKVMAVYGDAVCCCFYTGVKNLIFGGMNDGLIVVWDPSEHIEPPNSSNCEEQVIDNVRIEMPSYVSDISSSHNSKVIVVHPLQHGMADCNSLGVKSDSKEVCSLDEDGTIIIWGIVIRKTQSVVVNNRKIVQPRRICIPNLRVSLTELYPNLLCLQCCDMKMNNANVAYISTNYGCIRHQLDGATKRNYQMKIIYKSKFSQPKCLEICSAFPPYFVTGSNDGNIALYSNATENPLMEFSNKENETVAIDSIHWSHNKPYIFYAKDANNAINVWDLSRSDLYPVDTISFKENITCMKLVTMMSRYRYNGMSYMVMGTDTGSVYLHFLNSEDKVNNSEEYEENLKILMKYLRRL